MEPFNLTVEVKPATPTFVEQNTEALGVAQTLQAGAQPGTAAEPQITSDALETMVKQLALGDNTEARGIDLGGGVEIWINDNVTSMTQALASYHEIMEPQHLGAGLYQYAVGAWGFNEGKTFADLAAH